MAKISERHDGSAPLGPAAPGALRGTTPLSRVTKLSSTLRQRPLALCGFALLAAIVIASLLAPLVAPYDPIEPHYGAVFRSPSLQYPMGTDSFGRDLLSRVLWGARTSLTISIVSIASSMLLGGLLGMMSGYFAGPLDLILQRGIDVLMTLPPLILAMAMVSMLGPSETNVIIAIFLASLPVTVRIARSAVIAVRSSTYIEAAVALGCPSWRVLRNHILPNAWMPVAVVASAQLGWAILVESSLSFLGLGPPPPSPTWGGILSADGREALLRAPWLSIFPGVAIAATVFAFNITGDAIQELLDPRLRESRGGKQ